MMLFPAEWCNTGSTSQAKK